MDITTFEGLNNDIVCLILDKTLKPNPPGIDSRALASFASISARYASLMKERGWERACRHALPDLCEILLSGDKKSPGDAGWDCFAKLLTRCPGYQSKVVNLVKVSNHFPRVLDLVQVMLQGATGQTRGLETFDIALESHVSDSWLPMAPLRAIPKSFLKAAAGKKILPGLVRDKTPFFLLSDCKIGVPHVVRRTYTEWVAQRAKWNEWEAIANAQRSSRVPVAYFRIYRGMVADVSALNPGFAHKNGDSYVCDNVPAALDTDRKGAPKTPPPKQCPFCAKTMQRISSRFHGLKVCNSERN